MYPVLPQRQVRDSGSPHSVHNRESLWCTEPIRAGLFLLRLFYFWVLVSQGLGLFSLGSEGEGSTFDAETSMALRGAPGWPVVGFSLFLMERQILTGFYFPSGGLNHCEFTQEIEHACSPTWHGIRHLLSFNAATWRYQMKTLTLVFSC